MRKIVEATEWTCDHCGRKVVMLNGNLSPDGWTVLSRPNSSDKHMCVTCTNRYNTRKAHGLEPSFPRNVKTDLDSTGNVVFYDR